MIHRPSIETEAQVSMSGDPFCIIRWAGEAGQMTPGEMMQLGVQMIETSIEAERDSGFVRFFQSNDYEPSTIAGLLGELRKHRDQHRAEGFDQKGSA